MTTTIRAQTNFDTPCKVAVTAISRSNFIATVDVSAQDGRSDRFIGMPGEIQDDLARFVAEHAGCPCPQDCAQHAIWAIGIG